MSNTPYIVGTGIYNTVAITELQKTDEPRQIVHGAQVMVPFPVIKSVMAEPAREIHDHTDVAEALTVYNCHRRIGEIMENQMSAAKALQGRLSATSGRKSRPLRPNTSFLKADLDGIDFVDSEGLGSIRGTYILALSHGCVLMLVNVNSRVKDLLNITHLESVFGNRT